MPKEFDALTLKANAAKKVNREEIRIYYKEKLAGLFV